MKTILLALLAAYGLPIACAPKPAPKPEPPCLEDYCYKPDHSNELKRDYDEVQVFT